MGRDGQKAVPDAAPHQHRLMAGPPQLLDDRQRPAVPVCHATHLLLGLSYQSGWKKTRPGRPNVPARKSPPQNKKILVGGKIGERVEHKHRVNAVVCYIVLHAAQIVPGIKEVNLRKSLRQEGSQGVGVGIPDDQQPWGHPPVGSR